MIVQVYVCCFTLYSVDGERHLDLEAKMCELFDDLGKEPHDFSEPKTNIKMAPICSSQSCLKTLEYSTVIYATLL